MPSTSSAHSASAASSMPSTPGLLTGSKKGGGIIPSLIMWSFFVGSVIGFLYIISGLMPWQK